MALPHEASERAAAVPLAMTNIGPDQIPRKPLGRTGEQVSIIGLGGYHLGTMPSLDDAVRLVQEAVDAGVTFFTTRGSTMTTAARNGWGSACRAGATTCS